MDFNHMPTCLCVSQALSLAFIQLHDQLVIDQIFNFIFP